MGFLNSTVVVSGSGGVGGISQELLDEQLLLKVDKVEGKGLSSNDYTTAEKNKLNGIAANANNYTHPTNHPASMITEDATHRFVSDAEKAIWNSKADETSDLTKEDVELIQEMLLADVLVAKNITVEELTAANVATDNKNSYTLDSENRVIGQNDLDFARDKIMLAVDNIRFKIERCMYWIVVAGQDVNGYTIMGLGTKYANSLTHQLVDIVNGGLNIRYNANQFTSKVSYVSNVDIGDEIEIFNTEEKIIVNVIHKNTKESVKWFEVVKSEFPNCIYWSNRKLGFNLGISGAEKSSGGYTMSNGRIVASNITTNTTEKKNKFDIIQEDLKDRIEVVESKVEQGVSNITEDPTKKKYAVVLVAGQSNAVGYDESPVNGLFNGRINPRVKQLGLKGSNNMKIVDLTHCAENFQDMATAKQTNSANTNTTVQGTKGIHLPLGTLIAQALPDDYSVIILPCAYGATGFTSGGAGSYNESTMQPSGGGIKWSTTSPYYLAMRDRLKYVLDMNEANIFLGAIWIQGENDKDNAAGHLTGFNEMTQAFFDYFNNAGYGKRTKKGTFDKDIWFNVETVAHWYSQGQCQAIWDNYKAWNQNTYVEIPRETESNAVNGTGATSSTRPSHFGNDAFTKVVAPRVFEKLKNNM